MRSYYVYILTNKSTNAFYCGVTNNIERRLEEHNSGKTKSLRGYLPFELVYKEFYNDRVSAVRRERYIKAQKSRVFIENLMNVGS